MNEPEIIERQRACLLKLRAIRLEYQRVIGQAKNQQLKTEQETNAEKLKIKTEIDALLEKAERANKSAGSEIPAPAPDPQAPPGSLEEFRSQVQEILRLENEIAVQRQEIKAEEDRLAKEADEARALADKSFWETYYREEARVKLLKRLIVATAIIIPILVVIVGWAFLENRLQEAIRLRDTGDWQGERAALQVFSGAFQFYRYYSGNVQLVNNYKDNIYRLVKAELFNQAEKDIQELRIIYSKQKKFKYPESELVTLSAYVAIYRAVSQKDWDSAAQKIVGFTELANHPYTYGITDLFSQHPPLRAATRARSPLFWPPDGVWTGMVHQNDQEYSMHLQLKDCDLSQHCGTVRYPELDCTTTLAYKYFMNGGYSFSETRTSGPDSCVGEWLNLTPHKTGFSLSGSYQNQTWSAELAP